MATGVAVFTNGKRQEMTYKEFRALDKHFYDEQRPLPHGLIMSTDENGLHRQLPPNIPAMGLLLDDVVGNVFVHCEDDKAYTIAQMDKHFPDVEF